MKSFEELLKENYRSLEIFIRYHVSRKEDAEEILQETAILAFSHFAELEHAESFKAWIVSIARNRIKDYYRRRNPDQVPLDEKIACISIHRPIHAAVHETLHRLSEEDQALLHDRYWEELSVQEIAAKLQIAEGTVKSRLHSARKHFAMRYPKEELNMSRLPEMIPDYQIVQKDAPCFRTCWKELMGWFLVPEEGNRIRFGIYDFPQKTLTWQAEMKCEGKAQIHGLEGVKVTAIEKEGKEKLERHFVAQLTDTHCRYLAESHMEDGVEKIFTFLDGDAFLNNWGFGPENIGNEIDLQQKGLIRRQGNVITTEGDREVMDLVGRYDVTINGRTYDTVCLMDIGVYDDNTYTEQYIDRNGRTVLWRRFNKGMQRWNYDHFEEATEEELKDNEKIIVNGQECVHWYDCITDYIL